MLSNLPHWTGTAGNLRQVGNGYSAADPIQTPESLQPSAEQWIGGATERGAEDDERPGERLPVFATWGDPQRQLCEVVITVRALAIEAATLSFMSLGPYDVRPAMLLALFAEDPVSIARCVRYGERYLAVKFGRNDGPSKAAIQAAAIDGFAVVFGARVARAGSGTPERAHPSADDRAKQLRMRAAGYRALRGTAIRVYERRFAEAKEAYCLAQIEP